MSGTRSEEGRGFPGVLLSRSRVEVSLVLLCAAVAAVMALVQAPLLVRVPLGLLATLFLPGYSMTLALFPRATDLHITERLALSIGLSLATLSLLALALDVTPWRLHPTALVVGVTLCTAAGILTAWLRLWRSGQPDLPSLLDGLPVQEAMPRSFKVALGLLAGIFVVACAALTVTLMAPPPRLTEFYVLGLGGESQDYIRTVQIGQPAEIMVGIVNREAQTTRYSATVQSEDTVFGRVGPIELPQEATWQQNVPFTVTKETKELRLLLFKGEDPAPYRQLRLWVDAEPATAN